MKKTVRGLILSSWVLALAATGWVLAFPTPTLASSCSTTCSGGGEVTCEGYSCFAGSGGCSSYDSSGHQLESKKCGGDEEIY